MNNRSLIRLGVLGALAMGGLVPAPRGVAAQELPQVRLDEAIERALQRSPQMAQAAQSVDNAQESYRSSLGQFLPNINGTTGMGIRSSQRFDPTTDRVVSGSANSYNAGLSGNLVLFQGGRRFKELTRSRASLSAAEARRDDQRFQVRLQTEQLFFQALRQAELLEVARARIEQAQRSLELTRTRAQVGEATRSDTLRARLELVNARQAVLEAETALRNARFALGRQIGERGPVDAVPPDDLDPRPLALTEEEILALAEAQSPGVIAAEASTRAAAAAVSSAKTQWLPTISASSGYSWANQQASFSGGTTSWNINFSLSYPLFNRFQRETGIANAQYALRVARLQEDDERLAARQEADAALRNLETAERAIDIAREAVAVAEEDLRVVRERYQVNVAIILDVITSQIALDQARVDLVQARYDYLLARAELEAILGREL
ncbi:MAG: TolC family protein [Gemmatimonadetes bacterium]|nr:MAG: TolC family protein [Gemmatimonadota bacterium]